MSVNLDILCSGAFLDAFMRLSALLERSIDAKLCVSAGSSVNTGKNSIPMRLRGGESCDAAILFDDAASELAKDGLIRSGSVRPIAGSSIGLAVPQGASRPDIGTADALRRALLNADSIAYSSSQSGIYLSTVLFPKLGIADAIRAKCRRVHGERVGAVVARGDAEIGLQQMSELLPIADISVIGPLPAELQQITVLVACVPTQAAHPDAAAALIRGLRSEEARPILEDFGLDPSYQ